MSPLLRSIIDDDQRLDMYWLRTISNSYWDVGGVSGSRTSSESLTMYLERLWVTWLDTVNEAGRSRTKEVRRVRSKRCLGSTGAIPDPDALRCNWIKLSCLRIRLMESKDGLTMTPDGSLNRRYRLRVWYEVWSSPSMVHHLLRTTRTVVRSVISWCWSEGPRKLLRFLSNSEMRVLASCSWDLASCSWTSKETPWVVAWTGDWVEGPCWS